MSVHTGEVRNLKTGDVVLVTAVAGNFVTVVPAFDENDPIAGRYIAYRGVNFALDYPARVNPILLENRVLARVPLSTKPKNGNYPPKIFVKVVNRMQMLTYIDSMEDIQAVRKAENR